MKIVAAALLRCCSLHHWLSPRLLTLMTSRLSIRWSPFMSELTDPNRPAASKSDIVTPGFSPDEAGTVDDHLRRMNAGGMLPLPFDVTDIQPAPNNFAGATVAVPIGYHSTPPGPIVLVEQGRHWLITHDDAVTALDALWYNANRRAVYIPHL